MMFLSGFLIAYAIGRYIRLRDQDMFKHTARAIYEGWAEPDDADRIGWGRPDRDGRNISAFERGTEAGLEGAAKNIDKDVEALIAEFGQYDSETGGTDCGKAEETVNLLEEKAEELRALKGTHSGEFR